MTDDIRRLFEHAEREMRPEFQAELITLLEQGDLTADPSPWRDGAEFVADVQLEPEGSPHRRRWHPGAWLGVAAGLALFIALVVAPRASDDRDSPIVTSPVTTTAPAFTTAAPVAECGPVADPLGVVATTTGDIFVGLMPDGSSFCVIADATRTALAGSETIRTFPSSDSPVTAPTIVEQGPLDTTAYFFVVAIPEELPIASIRASGDQVRSFATRVGRRMLVIDTDYDSRATPHHATHDLNLYSPTGVVLATLVADTDALSSATGNDGP